MQKSLTSDVNQSKFHETVDIEVQAQKAFDQATPEYETAFVIKRLGINHKSDFQTPEP